MVERGIVEELAARKAVLPSARRAIARLREADADIAEIVDADIAYHRALVEALNSPRAARLHNSIIGEAHLCMAQVQVHRLLSPPSSRTSTPGSSMRSSRAPWPRHVVLSPIIWSALSNAYSTTSPIFKRGGPGQRRRRRLTRLAMVGRTRHPTVVSQPNSASERNVRSRHEHRPRTLPRGRRTAYLAVLDDSEVEPNDGVSTQAALPAGPGSRRTIFRGTSGRSRMFST